MKLDNRDLDTTEISISANDLLYSDNQGEVARVTVNPAVLFANALENWDERALSVIIQTLRNSEDDIDIAGQIADLLDEAQLDKNF